MRRTSVLAFGLVALFQGLFCFADEVRVSTAAELVRALRSDREIVLEPGLYDLSTVKNLRGRNIVWKDVFDGRELVLTGLKNLTLRGDTADGVEIQAVPRYAFVLSFEKCSKIKLHNLKIGHKEAGECSGGVLRLRNTQDFELEACTLYGSGTVGIDAAQTKNLVVLESVVEKCTYEALDLEDCDGAGFQSVALRENSGDPLIGVRTSKAVTFEGCDIVSNKGSVVFSVDAGSEVSFSGGTIRGNSSEKLFDAASGGEPRLDKVEYDGNAFDQGSDKAGEEEENEVVLDFAGAAFQLPAGWSHEIHKDEPGTATFTSPDGNAFGFFFPLELAEEETVAKTFAAGREALDELFKKNVGFSLNLKASDKPVDDGEIVRQSHQGLVVDGKNRATVRAQLLIMHGKVFALCVMWKEGNDFEDDAKFIFENLRKLEAAG